MSGLVMFSPALRLAINITQNLAFAVSYDTKDSRRLAFAFSKSVSISKYNFSVLYSIDFFEIPPYLNFLYSFTACWIIIPHVFLFYWKCYAHRILCCHGIFVQGRILCNQEICKIYNVFGTCDPQIFSQPSHKDFHLTWLPLQ